MTSLDKQTYTPHGWGKEGLICWAVGGCWGADRLGRGGGRKKETLVYGSRACGKGRERDNLVQK